MPVFSANYGIDPAPSVKHAHPLLAGTQFNASVRDAMDIDPAMARDCQLSEASTRTVTYGISDPAILEAASTRCGTTALKETRAYAWQHRPYNGYARHPVMTPDMIRQLPGRFALIIRGAMSPVVGHLPMAWNDPVYKRAPRAGLSIPALAPPAAQHALHGGSGESIDDWPLTDLEPEPLSLAAVPDEPADYPWQ